MGVWEDAAAEVNTPTEASKTSLWDETAKEVRAGTHASELAKHRWETLKAATEADTYPGVAGNEPYGGKPVLLGDLNRPINQGAPGAIPTLPTLTPVGANEAPPVERLARNANMGIINLAGNTGNFFINLANHPVDSLNELNAMGRAAGKAGLWASLGGFPAIRKELEDKGITPDDFNEMFLSDPVGTSAMVLGGAEGLHRGVVGAEPKPAPEISGPGEPIPEAAPIPQPVPPIPKTHFEQSLESIHGLLKEGGTPGRGAIRDVGEGGTVNPKDVVSTVTNAPKGSGIHAVQALMAEYQLVRPDLTWKQVKAAFSGNREAVLRAIAYAREKDAINATANTEMASSEIPGKLAAQTAEGVGVDPTVPINRPLDAFDNNRLQDMRNAVKTVTEYHQNRVPQPFRGEEPLINAEKRNPANAPRRAAITQKVDEIKQLGLDHIAVLDEISRRKQSGEIDGPTESAMMREANRSYSEKLVGPSTTEPMTPETQQDLDNIRKATKTVDALTPTIVSGDVEAAAETGARTTATETTPTHFLKDLGDSLTDTIGNALKNDAIAQSEYFERIKLLLNDVADGVHQLWDTKGGLNPAMTYLKKAVPAFYDHAVGDIVAHGLATFRHNAYMRSLVRDVLGEGLDMSNRKGRKAAAGELTKRLDFFGKIIMDDQSKSVDMKNSEIVRLQRTFDDAKTRGDKPAQDAARAGLDKLGATPDSTIAPNKLPQMTPAELATEAANPMWKKAVQHHIDNLQADIEGRAQGAGVRSYLYGPRGTYISLKRYQLKSEAPPNGSGVVSTYSGSGSAPSPFDYTHVRTSSAKGRTGNIPEGHFVSLDYVEHALNSRVRRYQSFYRRKFQEAVMAADLTKPDGTVDKTVKMPDGREVPVVQVVIEDLDSGLKIADVRIPKPLADAYRLAVDKPYNEKYRLLAIVNNLATEALVAMPAEPINHGLNVGAVLMASDKVGAHRGLAGEIAQWIPVLGKAGLALDRIINQKGARLAANMDTAARLGGLRTSNFKSVGTTAEFVKQVTKGAEKNPKQWLFGYPHESTPALESKVTGSLLDVIREGEPGISDRDAVARLNSIRGTYTTKLAPLAAKILGDVYPFARATTALARTGLQVMTGFDPSTGKWSIKGFTQNVLMPALAMQLFAKSMDDNGKWGHEHEGWQAGDGVFTHKGITYRIPFRLYMQAVYRGLTVTGIRAAITQYVDDEKEYAFKRLPSPTTVEDVVKAQARGVGNYVRNLIGPIYKAAYIATTGTIPYQLPNGDYMKLETPNPKHPLVSRVGASLAAGFAPYSKLEEKGGNAFPSATGRGINKGLGFVGLNIKAEPASKETAITASGNAAFRDSIDDAISGVLKDARNLDPSENKRAFITKEIKSRIPSKGLIIIHGKPTPVQVYALEESLRRSLPNSNPLPPKVQESLRMAR